MRRIACACFLMVAVSSCDPKPKTMAAATVSGGAMDKGAKVPITTRSEEARTLYLQGRAFAEQLRAHDAEALFERASSKDPTFALAEYNLAQTAFTAKERVEHLTKAVALADGASEGERLLILTLQAAAKADPATAQQYAESLASRYSQDERAHWVLGNAYSAQQLYDRAVREYQRAIDLNPNYSPAYNSLGYAYRPSGNTADAEKAFQRYITLVPNDPNPYDSYGELLMKMGRFDASIAQYQKALSMDSHFGASHVGIAADRMFAGRHDAAIAEAQTYYDAARDDGERRIALLSQTMTYVDEGATDQALQTVDRISGVDRASGDTVNMAADDVATADILLDAGKVDAARDRYRRAYDLVAASSLSTAVKQDNDLARHYNMARVALEKHDLPMARMEASSYMSGAEAKQNDFRLRQAHELNALLALHDKQFDQSLAELARANQQNPAVLFAMAQAYRGKGNTAKAKQLVEQAANMYILPTLAYVFVRARAKRMV